MFLNTHLPHLLIIQHKRKSWFCAELSDNDEILVIHLEINIQS